MADSCFRIQLMSACALNRWTLRAHPLDRNQLSGRPQ